MGGLALELKTAIKSSEGSFSDSITKGGMTRQSGGATPATERRKEGYEAPWNERNCSRISTANKWLTKKDGPNEQFKSGSMPGKNSPRDLPFTNGAQLLIRKRATSWP